MLSEKDEQAIVTKLTELLHQTIKTLFPLNVDPANLVKPHMALYVFQGGDRSNSNKDGSNDLPRCRTL